VNDLIGRNPVLHEVGDFCGGHFLISPEHHEGTGDLTGFVVALNYYSRNQALLLMFD
jgi:hypothetical protein